MCTLALTYEILLMMFKLFLYLTVLNGLNIVPSDKSIGQVYARALDCVL